MNRNAEQVHAKRPCNLHQKFTKWTEAFIRWPIAGPPKLGDSSGVRITDWTTVDLIKFDYTSSDRMAWALRVRRKQGEKILV